ncbi:MAG: hypothetical protein Q4C36_09815, partial [Coriobacteriia bacterium]|nr:hypothetical protein [Coriobacteriia bacterium]
ENDGAGCGFTLQSALILVTYTQKQELRPRTIQSLNKLQSLSVSMMWAFAFKLNLSNQCVLMARLRREGGDGSK